MSSKSKSALHFYNEVEMAAKLEFYENQLQALEARSSTPPRDVIQEVNNTLAGLRGENETLYQLQDMDTEMTVLQDIRFTLNGETYTEIDWIVILPKSIILLECKNWRVRNMILLPDGHLVYEGSGRTIPYVSPFPSMEDKPRKLRSLLDPSLTTETRTVTQEQKLLFWRSTKTTNYTAEKTIAPLVVLTNPRNRIIEDQRTPGEQRAVPFVYADGLKKKMWEMERTAPDTPRTLETCKRIAGIFYDAHTPRDYYVCPLCDETLELTDQDSASPQYHCTHCDYTQKIGEKEAQYLQKMQGNTSKKHASSKAWACPNCGGPIRKGRYGYYCENRCGMNLYKVYRQKLSDKQVAKLLYGDSLDYFDEMRILPEVEEVHKEDKTYYYWKKVKL